MKINAKTFEEYFVLSGKHEADLRTLDALIREHAPSLAPLPSIAMGESTILGYGSFVYKPKSSKTEQTWPIIALASQKNYISLYACAVIDGEYVAEKYKERLGNVNCGKSCIRLKRLDDIHQDGLVAMLKDIEVRYKNGEQLYAL
jgi:hypothetical protein